MLDGDAPFVKLGVWEALTELLPLTVDVGVTKAVPVPLLVGVAVGVGVKVGRGVKLPERD